MSSPTDRNLHKTVPRHKDPGHDDTVAEVSNSLDLLCTKILVSLGNGFRDTHQYGFVCVSPEHPPLRTGHHTDHTQRLWHPLKERKDG